MRRLIAPTAVFLLLLAVESQAGGGPETTLVVANAASPLSRQVANEYLDMRDIPRSHLVLLEDVPIGGRIKLDVFREKIWAPIAAHLEKRGLEGRIDLVTYSVDLPYAVDFKSVVKEKIDHRIGGWGSLNGLTYLHQQVEAGAEFWGWQTNRYFRLASASPIPKEKLRPLSRAEQAAHAQAMQHYQQGRHRDAAQAFAAFLGSYPDAAEPWYHYACCLNRIGQGVEAIKALERAADLGFLARGHAAKDTDLESLKEDARFKAVLRRFGENVGTAEFRYHPTMGFGANQGRYMLSTHLGWTGHKGNSVSEVLRYLRAAAGADGTSPDGTVYICRNQGVRSTARESYFRSTVNALRALGRKVEILEAKVGGQDGKLPIGKGDVIGAVVGVAGFDWGKSKSRILPGAICEHLTSFGAEFTRAGQTKLTEFLKYGAAGASGTVVEPLAIHFKFPNPMIHAHYAEGCSLAEAFYQSLGGPYQLMIVGDGLARPFAKFVKVDPGAPPGPWKGKVSLAPDGGDGNYELWVDGVRKARGTTLTLDTTALDDGYHDIRVVSVSEDRIETRSFARVDAVVANHERTGQVQWRTERRVTFGEPIVLSVKGPAKEARVLYGDRVVGEAKRQLVEVNSGGIGPGPVALVPRIVFADGTAWRGPPERFEIIAPPPPKAPKAKPDDRPRLPGLRGRMVKKDGKERELILTHIGSVLTGSPIKDVLRDRDVTRLELAGEIRALKAGAYQIEVLAFGRLTAEVAGRTIAKEVEVPERIYLYTTLAEGWNPVRFLVEPGEKGRPHLVVTLSGESFSAPPAVRHGKYRAVKPQPVWKGKLDKTIKVPADGLVLDFKRAARNVSALAVFPAPSDGKFPTEWVVETKAGSRWKAVKGVEALVAAGVKGAPAYVELSFRPLTARQLRIRPAGKARPTVARLEALARPK